MHRERKAMLLAALLFVVLATVPVINGNPPELGLGILVSKLSPRLKDIKKEGTQNPPATSPPATNPPAEEQKDSKIPPADSHRDPPKAFGFE